MVQRRQRYLSSSSSLSSHGDPRHANKGDLFFFSLPNIRMQQKATSRLWRSCKICWASLSFPFDSVLSPDFGNNRQSVDETFRTDPQRDEKRKDPFQSIQTAYKTQYKPRESRKIRPSQPLMSCINIATARSAGFRANRSISNETAPAAH